MAGTVSQKPQGLEEGQTGHGMTSGIVGDPWNQPCGWELPAGPGFWTSGVQNLFALQWDSGPFCHLIFSLLFLESW